MSKKISQPKPMKTKVVSPTKLIRTAAKKATGKHKPVDFKDLLAQRLSIEEELFCQYYVKNAQTRGNGTWSYNAAFSRGLENKSKDDGIYEEIPSAIPGGEPIRGKCLQESSFKIEEAHCAVEASKTLRLPKISQRITKLLNEMLTDEVVDAELTKVILQDDQLKPKVSAIAEYNKLKRRTTDTSVTMSFGNIDPNISDSTLEEALAVIEKQTKFYKKQ